MLPSSCSPAGTLDTLPTETQEAHPAEPTFHEHRWDVSAGHCEARKLLNRLENEPEVRPVCSVRQ